MAFARFDENGVIEEPAVSGPLTKAGLVALLAGYSDDTPIFDGRGFDLHASSVFEQKYDDYSESTRDDEGWEVPAVKVGISIGRRF